MGNFGTGINAQNDFNIGAVLGNVGRFGSNEGGFLGGDISANSGFGFDFGGSAAANAGSTASTVGSMAKQVSGMTGLGASVNSEASFGLDSSALARGAIGLLGR